ncbi:MAG: tetratricopeptide repeat protein, partial [Elusimicrobiota bacterium]|nr:tetratricopeptide repeat protein [Elusimicrobiota bacterium]
MEIMNAWWNLASGKKAGLPAPAEYAGTDPYGPIETKYTKKLMDRSVELFQKAGETLSKADSDAWLKDPANGENGKSPFALIYEERKSRNHPYPDKIGYSMKIQGIENKAAKPASEKVDTALGFMLRNNFEKAAQLFEEALTVLKHDKSVSFRIFGNLGICYALTGEREKAIEALREALRHNPDYDRAREHLSDIESMTEKQYKKFLKEGPANLTHTEWRG